MFFACSNCFYISSSLIGMDPRLYCFLRISLTCRLSSSYSSRSHRILHCFNQAKMTDQTNQSHNQAESGSQRQPQTTEEHIAVALGPLPFIVYSDPVMQPWQDRNSAQSSGTGSGGSGTQDRQQEQQASAGATEGSSGSGSGSGQGSSRG